MILFRILFWLVGFALRLALALLIFPFRVLGAVGRLGGGRRVSRGPLTFGTYGASPWGRSPWGGNPWN